MKVTSTALSGSTSLPPEALFRQYYPRLCDFAGRFLAHTDEAEDVVQDSFVAFLERQADIDGHMLSVKSFLYTTVRNACLNRLRHDKVKARYLDENFAELTDDTYILDSMIHAEVMGDLHQAIRSLPDGCALILKMGYLEGLKNSQVAEKLGISINTVKSQKQRALVLLRGILKPQTLLLITPFLLS